MLIQMFRTTLWFLLAALVTAPLSVARAAGELYFNDFSSEVGPEWSTPRTEITPLGGRRFLGQFGNEAASLSLSNLPAHSALTIGFDLFVIRSWDGNGEGCCGPDVFRVDVDGTNALTTTFATFIYDFLAAASSQAFPSSFSEDPSATISRNAPGTGAIETGTLGYVWSARIGPMIVDNVYRLRLRIAHVRSEVQFDFAATGLQLIEDESWGLDNVVVEIAQDAPQLTIRPSQMELCFNSKNNHSYQMQYRSLRTTNLWVNIGEPVAGNGATNCAYVAVPPGEPSRFYRVQENP
jgi:hypothetical protein